MSRLDKFYNLHQLNGSLESFVICPQLFLEGKSKQEIAAMAQLYQSAYKKSLEDYRKMHGNDFDMGAGI